MGQVVPHLHRHREVGRVRCWGVKDLDDGRAARLCLFQELHHTADIESPEDGVDVRRAARELLPVLLGEAAADGDLHSGVSLLNGLQVPEVAVELVVGVLADAASVEDDDVGFLEVVGPLHPVGPQ